VQFDEVIRGVPADKIVHTNFGKTISLDLSTQQAEFEQDMFPLNIVLTAAIGSTAGETTGKRRVAMFPISIGNLS